jgi:hypothetical protein
LNPAPQAKFITRTTTDAVGWVREQLAFKMWAELGLEDVVVVEVDERIMV